MYKYILKRLVTLIPVILGVSFLVYMMLDMTPGTVLDVIGEDLSPEEIARITEELALNRSVFYRYFMYMKDLIRGDLGTSYIYNMEVWDLYMMRLPATIKLTAASVLVGVVLSLPLGIKAAVKSGSLMDNGCTVIGLLGLSIPNFWLGLMLVVWFSLGIGWFPSSGDDGTWKSLILPALTIGTGLMATIMRTTRSSMLDVLQQDYLRTARSKGVAETTVVNKHGLRNALIPIITVVGTQIGSCLGGAVVTENVFSWPGVGRLIIDAVNQRDTTTVTGCIIMTVILVCLVQLAVDILYAFVDPRLRSQYEGGKKKTKKAQTAGGKQA